MWRIAEDCGSELQELYLSGFNVSHVGLRALSIQCLQIRLLDVSRCEIVDDLNLRIIASLWRTLVFLDLSMHVRMSLRIFNDDCCQVIGIDHFWLLYTTSSKIMEHTGIHKLCIYIHKERPKICVYTQILVYEGCPSARLCIHKFPYIMYWA